MQNVSNTSLDPTKTDQYNMNQPKYDLPSSIHFHYKQLQHVFYILVLSG
jgi:hypothetical protein